MGRTAQDIFNLAIQLMNEGDDETGVSDTRDNKDFKFRALPVLNVLQQECCLASDTAPEAAPGVRTVFPILTGMDDVVPLDDFICIAVLPYGLAAHLLMEVNPDLAQKLLSRYKQLLSDAKRNIPAVSEDIGRPYGGTEWSRFGRWGTM
ncbi:MAG: hypothetical protein ACOX0U_04935 [Oscillospiraceae bacterium]|jgi:hypothetical protein